MQIHFYQVGSNVEAEWYYIVQIYSL